MRSSEKRRTGDLVGAGFRWLAWPWKRAGESDRTFYLALNELVRRYSAGDLPSPSTQESLTRYECRVFSQSGEDGVLAELLRRVGATNRSFVEFGIDGGTSGNCVFLADVMGWSGLFMESQQGAFAELQRKYSANPLVQTRRAFVRPDNVEALFEQGSVPTEPDILSIDVDGNDYWIWQALARFSPRIVVIEYNSHLPLKPRRVQPYDPDGAWHGADHFGASLGALRSLGEQKGYQLVHTELTGTNAFFVRKGLTAVLPAPDAVPWRAPNKGLIGGGHLPHTGAPPLLDLDAAAP